MKKVLKKIVIPCAMALLMVTSIQASNSGNKTTASGQLSQNLLADDDPYYRACEQWCEPWGYLCVLNLADGGQLWCIYWEEPLIDT